MIVPEWVIMRSMLILAILVVLTTSIGLIAISDNALAQQDPRTTSQQQQQQQLQQQQQQQVQPLQPRDFGLTSNFWGDVVSDSAQEQHSLFGQHTSDPVPSIPGREVPRDGVGNVQVNPSELEKHPSFHAFELCQTVPNAPGCPTSLPDTTIPP